MILPTIHLNGTSAQELYEKNRAAAHALREAFKRLHQAAPNSRDFYPQGQHAYAQAQEQYEAQCDSLRAVLAEVEAIAAHASDRIASDARRTAIGNTPTCECCDKRLENCAAELADDGWDREEAK